ncbi:NAD-dependent epimerase/dehydratase family protein [Neogemmobacter tilapiae]|nr:NAD(P)-dependent oxidoreductase [Gemmobacter tilapiae]
MKILVTGAAGKVGQAFIAGVRQSRPGTPIVALCHNRLLPKADDLTLVRGSLADAATAQAALAQGVTHVVHLATCKETPDEVMDVTVKGLFRLLEAFRTSPTAQRFLLIGGDAAVGHFFHRHPGPVTEETPHKAYPGCYALSKVLEEVMVQQYGIQYGLDWCCLRAPWIMEKDDFRASLSFGPDLFGGPDWRAMVGDVVADKAMAKGAIPLLLDPEGNPVKRNFVHVQDLVAAILIALDHPAARQRLYNIAMDEPVDYGALAAYLHRTRGLGHVPVQGPYHSTWLSNTRAKAELGWRPQYNLEKLVESAWSHIRAADDPRRIWYPG